MCRQCASVVCAEPRLLSIAHLWRHNMSGRKWSRRNLGMISQVCPVSVIASSLLVYSPKPLSLPPSELFFSCALIEHHLTSPLYVFLAPFVRSPSLASELQRPDGGRLRRRGGAEASYGRRHRRRQGASFLMPPEMPCPQSLAQIAQEKISTPHLLVPQSHL